MYFIITCLKILYTIFKSFLNYYSPKPAAHGTALLSDLKVGLSPKNCVVCLIESPLKMIKNAFYFILKVFFVLKADPQLGGPNNF